MNTSVHDNVAENNNLENFAPEGGLARLIPSGVGVLILGSDHNEVFHNVIRDNKTTGVAIFSLTGAGVFDVNEIDVGPLPEGNWVYDNTYHNNGYDPDPFVKDLGIPVGDILWDGSGRDNRFDEQDASSFPPLLPGNGWPAFARQAYGNVLNFVIGLVS
jgi:hypothetical protein